MQRRAGTRSQRWLVVLLVSLAIVGGLAMAATAVPGSAATTSDALADQSGDVTASTYSGSAASTGDASAAQSDDPIVERVEYSSLSDRPDRVEARIVYEIPDDVDSLSFTIVGGSYDVVGLDGFEQDGGTFEWDESGDGGAVTIRHDASESFRNEGLDEQFVGGTDDWAIVARPQTSTSWNYRWNNPGLEYEMTTAGEGYAGTRFAFLGSHGLHTRAVDGEQITLVMPDAADPKSDPAEIVDSVAYASDRLRFGNRNDEVVLIAAPTGEIDWEPPGLAVGSDARIAADRSVGDRVNVWVHEYVHTRQYRDADTPDGDAVADDAHWLVEGSADYYAALMSLEEGRIDFETFRDVLERGTEPPESDAVLADRTTWADNDAEYEKGALVVGAIDRELRAATDGSATFRDVMADWNSAETFTADGLEAAAEEHGDDSVREFVHEYTRTSAAPTAWTREDHTELFESPIARFDYRVVSDPPLSVAGPYREGTLPTSLVVGENVSTRIRVENVGDVAGAYRATLSVGGREGAVATGDLAPGERQTVDLEHRLARIGDVRIVAGDVSRTVQVSEPATPRVSQLRVRPREPTVGDDVDVVLTVSNPSSRPADGEVVVRADGERIGGERVRLAGGENATVEVSTSFDDAGDYDVSAGELSLEMTVTEGGPLDALPAPGVPASLVAILVGASLLVRRR